MHNRKDIQFAGKYDFDKHSAEKFASFHGATFSINIFQWKLKNNGKELKPSACIVRIHASPSLKEKAFSMADNIIKQLEDGEWDGRKNVFI